MSSIIKFRAWHKSEKKMYGVKAISFASNSSSGEILGPVEVRVETWVDAKQVNAMWLPITSIELLQFSGLFDYYKKEIYEGDILLNREWDYIYVVVYHADSFALKRNKSRRPDEYDHMMRNIHMACEVIGNIYEHPELLENDE
jgi:uncharacterized phage protein (TIGR01671 family)